MTIVDLRASLFAPLAGIALLAAGCDDVDPLDDRPGKDDFTRPDELSHDDLFGEDGPPPPDLVERSGPARPGQTYQDYVVKQPGDDSDGDGDWEVKPERVFVPGAREALRLRPGSSELYLMTQIRDEAHRFAITHHRKRRGKRALHSALDDIPGVGPALKKALIQRFGTVAEIRAAEPAKLAEVKGVGPALAQRIHDALREH